MFTLPADLPAKLKKAGLEVTEIDGWRDRGRPASTGGFNPVGVLNHHTGAHDPIGDFDDDLSYARWMFLTGRSDLPAPLTQLALSTEGRVFIGAAGRSNHAGDAKSVGSVAAGDGNSLYVGIEWMLSGTQPIPQAMYQAAAKLNAVLLDILGSSEQAVACHYQTSVTGKWDIGDPNGIAFNGHKVLDVPKFRRAVAAARLTLHAPPPPKYVTVDMVTFNPWVGNKDLRVNLRKVINATDSPVGLSLQEMVGEDNLTLSGYHRIDAPKKDFPHEEARSTVLMVRERGVKLLNSGVLDVGRYDKDGWTWGPKGQPKTSVKHPPRVFPWARIEVGGREFCLLAGHRVPAGFTVNKSEWAAEHQAIVDWFGHRPNVPLMAGMDWNDRTGGDEWLGVDALAKRVKGELELRGIDGGLLRGFDRGTSRKLEGLFGSDAHRPVLITGKKELR